MKHMLGLEDEKESIMTKKREGDTFEDDDFYDQTNFTKNQNPKMGSGASGARAPPQKVENYASLKKEYDGLIERKSDINESLYKLAMHEDIDDEDDDEFEKFMRQNDGNLRAEKKTSLIDELKQIQVKLKETSDLIYYVRPQAQLEKEEDVVKRLNMQKELRKEAKEAKHKKNCNIMENLKNKAKLVAQGKEFHKPIGIGYSTGTNTTSQNELGSDEEAEFEESLNPKFLDTTAEEQRLDMGTGMDDLDDDNEMANLKKRHSLLVKGFGGADADADKLTESVLKKMRFGPSIPIDRNVNDSDEVNQDEEKLFGEVDDNWVPKVSYEDIGKFKPKGY